MSLILLITLLLAFIAVTPIDVIVQTSSASSSGIKLFIVVIVCVVFLVVSFALYFQRIYQHRVSMNDIPSKSVYVPYEHDFPKPVFKHIERKFKQCQAIKIEAGPLNHKCVTINHPGLSPPIYIQERNTGNEGNLLPPNLLYEDVVHSLGDKFNLSDGFKSQLPCPKHYTLRDIMIHLSHILIDDKCYDPKDMPDINRLLNLYEKFKFGPSLIKEHEMVEFMVIFTRVSGVLLDKLGSVFSTRKRRFARRRSTSVYSNSRSDFRYSYSDPELDPEMDEKSPDRSPGPSPDPSPGLSGLSQFSDLSPEDPQSYYPHRHSVVSKPHSSSYSMNRSSANESRRSSAIESRRSSTHESDDSIGSIVKRNVTNSTTGSVLKKNNSVSSAGSVIKKKLSISDDIPRNSIKFDRNYSVSDNSEQSTRWRTSGDIVPAFKLDPSTPERRPERLPSPTRLRDIEIKRLKSPKRRKKLDWDESF